MEQYDEGEIKRIYAEGIVKARQAQRTNWSGDALKVRPSWEIMRSYDKEEVISKAIELGWAENKVQVKAHQLNEDVWDYYIEPYEEDCNCSSLLKYRDYAPSGA